MPFNGCHPVRDIVPKLNKFRRLLRHLSEHFGCVNTAIFLQITDDSFWVPVSLSELHLWVTRCWENVSCCEGGKGDDTDGEVGARASNHLDGVCAVEDLVVRSCIRWYIGRQEGLLRAENQLCRWAATYVHVVVRKQSPWVVFEMEQKFGI